MAKVTVTICDVCKERIAVAKCPICGKDVCNQCSKEFEVFIATKFSKPIEFWKAKMCKDCYNKLDEKGEEFLKLIREKLSDKLNEIAKEVLQ